MDRKLRDSVVSVHNAYVKYTNATETALAHVKTIADCRKTMNELRAGEKGHTSVDQDQLVNEAMCAGQILNACTSSMHNYQQTITSCIASTVALLPLLQYPNVAVANKAIRIFNQMLNMICKNLKCWDAIVEDVILTSDSDVLLTILAAAVHLPFINDQLNAQNLQTLAEMSS